MGIIVNWVVVFFFSIFFHVQPENWGRWTHFDHMCQRGWFNHQPVLFFCLGVPLDRTPQFLVGGESKNMTCMYTLLKILVWLVQFVHRIMSGLKDLGKTSTTILGEMIQLRLGLIGGGQLGKKVMSSNSSFGMGRPLSPINPPYTSYIMWIFIGYIPF